MRKGSRGYSAVPAQELWSKEEDKGARSYRRGALFPVKREVDGVVVNVVGRYAIEEVWGGKKGSYGALEREMSLGSRFFPVFFEGIEYFIVRTLASCDSSLPLSCRSVVEL